MLLPECQGVSQWHFLGVNGMSSLSSSIVAGKLFNQNDACPGTFSMTIVALRLSIGFDRRTLDCPFVEAASSTTCERALLRCLLTMNLPVFLSAGPMEKGGEPYPSSRPLFDGDPIRRPPQPFPISAWLVRRLLSLLVPSQPSPECSPLPLKVFRFRCVRFLQSSFSFPSFR
jgi:hypothetical protein